jgi:23S rRNA (cytidine1920-2'-O)/16S rRNA (cytidine1409-2'-O)-methyltransferase
MIAKRSRPRADQRLVELGLAPSRSVAQALVLAGRVWRATPKGPVRVDKAGAPVLESDELVVEERPRFVSRGGDKLEGALVDLEALGHAVLVRGRVCLDVGASTGGFTDCLLQRDAAHVYAVDVGRAQLAERLRSHARVDAREGQNARTLEARDFDRVIELVVVDASFIGLDKLLPAIARVLEPARARGLGPRLLALVKPQFEVGREVAARGRGVVRDEAEREAAFTRVLGAMAPLGFVALASVDSRVHGPKGNRERFVLAELARGASTEERSSE